MTSARRLAWVDVLKGLGIIFVAAGHHTAIWTNSQELGRAFYSFNIPLFFFITGLTLDYRMTGRALIVRALACVIPYVVLSLASMPMIFHLHPDVTWLDVLLGVAYGTGHTIYTVPLWFLPCLASTLFLVFILDRVERLFTADSRSSNALVQVTLFVALQCAWQFAISFDYELVRGDGWGRWRTAGAPWSIEVALAGASYVILGRLFTRVFGDSDWMTRPQWIALLSVAALFVLMNLLWRPRVDFNWRYDLPVGLSPVIAMAGILGAVLLAISLRNGRVVSFLRWLGTSTILILWAHTTIEKGVFKLLDPYVGTVIAIVASIFIALLLPAVAAWLVKRIPPINALITPNAFLKELLPVKPHDMAPARRASADLHGG